MKSFIQRVSETRRLALLEALRELDGYTSGSLLLMEMLAGLALPLSRVALKGELGWLHEAGLLTLTEGDEGALIATLTPKGLDVANGLERVDGVRRPDPR